MAKEISITAILADLENGLTRKTSSNNYDENIGSIQEKYDLSGTEIDELFKHPKLKGKKTKKTKAPSFVIVDDTEEEVVEEVVNETFELEPEEEFQEEPVLQQDTYDGDPIDDLL